MKHHCYFPSPKDDEKRRKALQNAKARGSAATEWFKINSLTKETQDEFNSLMKKNENTR